MKKLLSILIMLLFISGCKTTAGYKQSMSTWIGGAEIDLIRKNGTPDSTYTSNNIKFLVYEWSNTSRIYYHTSDSGYTYTTGGNTYSCKTTFEVKNKIITNVRWAGNKCRAEEKDIKPVKVKKINKKSYENYKF